MEVNDRKKNARDMECIISSRIWRKMCEGENNELQGAKGEGPKTRKDKERGDEVEGGKERGGELVMTAR